jgi:2-dehydro-3-deoxygalactonokinase
MKPFCAAIDWGTTRFRLWLLAEDGSIVSCVRTDEGLQTSAKKGFSNILLANLAKLDAPSDLPVVICGMAGSRQGWQEAPYLDAPTILDAIITGATRIRGDRDVRILPGIAQRDLNHPDVMRGEETQLLGLQAVLVGSEGQFPQLVCMPGTHSKWVAMKNASISRFSTFMTGELFALLSKNSVLSPVIGNNTNVDPANPEFLSAVDFALQRPALVSSRLFSLRASNLLAMSHPESGTAGLSGLLIGMELAGAFSCHGRSDNLMLLASGNLGALYKSALAAAGIEARQIDVEECSRLGLYQAAKTYWLNDFAPLKAGKTA